MYTSTRFSGGGWEILRLCCSPVRRDGSRSKFNSMVFNPIIFSYFMNFFHVSFDINFLRVFMRSINFASYDNINFQNIMKRFSRVHRNKHCYLIHRQFFATQQCKMQRLLLLTPHKFQWNSISKFFSNTSNKIEYYCT